MAAVVLVVAFTAAGINTDGRQSVDDASGTFRSQAVSFPGTKLPNNIRSHELSSPTTVALLGRMGLLGSRYSMHIMSFLTTTISRTFEINIKQCV